MKSNSDKLRTQMMLDSLMFRVQVDGSEYFVHDVSLDSDDPSLVLIECSTSKLPEPDPIDVEFCEVTTQVESKKKNRKAAGRSPRR